MKKIAIVGAGFSGSVIARELAERGYSVDVFDSREHVAGNCYTARDTQSGIMLHVYGPHIFHTSNERVWEYVQRFDRFMPFINRVKAHARGEVFSLPINLMTINQLFNKQFSPAEARAFIAEQGDQSITEPRTFEDQALRFVGRKMYETFFRGYTRKQWGLEPSELPASILKRLPVRFNYNDNYYGSKYQGIPEHGYTYIVERILEHTNIRVHLSTSFSRDQAQEYAHVFYSGPIDAWFNHTEGRLSYRTLDFETVRAEGDYQGNPVINYCDEDVPWTRVAEHKHFTPWEEHDQTVLFREHSRLCGENDTPYYPIRLVHDKARLQRYVELAKAEQGVTFVGRLGTYRYLDMHITIAEALDAAEQFLTAQDAGNQAPTFCIDPLA
ncbi:UDP-galactopyranose mutase [Acetobacter thailandicus]|uniref:UDP-galactopyranose mutase n=1 Tax=Acetobacter thailandicus TaxID=1502842 RepID=UPI001BAA539F|nr:UDP-galactopyranose mutase [Acetobacter thailandicus]MBS0961334.1 UDP-galactopyranose mutase [Acetobacter thailandicus]